MRKILTFNGSPRLSGNTSILLQNFIDGAKTRTNQIQQVNPYEINLEFCRGCLRCNLIGKCSISNDDWHEISKKIHEADVLVFATPIYFHHVSAPLKIILDRFRSFVKVQITEKSLKHTPWSVWNKDFVLILSMGSSDTIDAKPVIELFEYLISILGENNRLHIITAKRLAVIKQVQKNEIELTKLYQKLQLPETFVKEDYSRNQDTIKKCFELGTRLASGF